MATLSSANTKYTAEQLAKATGISAETLATWGLTEATDTLTISQLAEMASSDAQAKKVLEKIVAQNAQAVVNGEVTASNVALTASEGGATLATGAFTTAIKANISAMWTWMTTTPIGWLTLLVGAVFAVVKAYDALTVSVEEQKEKMEESLSAYEDAKSELSNITTELESQEQAMDELLAKEKLTYAEKGQLEELQAITQELRIQKDLAEKEENRTEKQLAKDATDLFNKQFGEYDISESGISEALYQSDAFMNVNSLDDDKNNISSMIAAYIKFNEQLNEAYGSGTQEDIDNCKEAIENVEDSLFSTATELQTQQTNISDYYNTIKDIPYEDLTPDQQEIVDSYNAISNAIALIYKQLDPNAWNTMQIDNLFATDGVEKTKEELVDMAKEGTLDEKTIQSYSTLNSTLENSNMVLEDGQSAASALCDEMYALADAEKSVEESVPDETDISFSDIFSLKDAENNLTDLGKINEEIDKFQSAYRGLKEAMDSYNETGTFTLDQVQEIISYGGDYLKYLMDENGNLQLNEEALNKVAIARINEMRAKSLSNLMDNLDKITTEEQALNYLETQLLNTATAYDALTASRIKAWSENALENGISEGTINKVTKSFNNQVSAINEMFNNISLDSIYKSSSSSASKTAEKTMEDIQKEWKEYLDGYLAMYKAELDAGLIDFNTFLNKSRSLLDEYYRDGKISAKDYWDSVKNLYENQLSIYDKVLSAVTRRIEKEVDGIQDIIDGLEKQNDTLQKQLDEYDSILSVVDEVYEKQIQSLEDEKELLQDKIDAINDANDALDLQYRKEEAIYALKRAKEQHTKKLFNGKEFVYTTDSNAIRDAQQTIQDIKTEELINNIEKEQDALDNEIEKLEEFKEKWQEITSAKETEQNKQLAIALWGKDYEKFILQNRISDIKNFKNKYVSIQQQIDDNSSLIDSYKEKIEYYQNLKEQWSSISDAYKNAQEDQYATMVLGAQWEKDVLNGRIDTLNKFKDEYISIQQAITSAAKEAAQAQAQANAQAQSSSSSGGSGGSSGSAPSTPTHGYHVVHKLSKGFSTQSEATSKIVVYDGNGVYQDKDDNKWYVYKREGYSATVFSSYNEAKKSHVYDSVAPWVRGIVKYASGTSNAKKGLNLVGEAGTETYIDNDGNVSLVTKPSLIEMEGGETVKNAKETQDLLNPDNLVPVEMMEFPCINGKILKLSTDELMNKVASVMPNYSSMIQSAIQMPKYDFTPVSRDNSTSVSIGEIHLHEVNNVDSFANAIIRELPSKISQKLGQ